MIFTASLNVEDSHDALSSTVDCASTSTGDKITRPPNKIAKRNAPDILTHCRLTVNDWSQRGSTQLEASARYALRIGSTANDRAYMQEVGSV